ncbi:hypothetical protein LSH36_175g04047 [Paralvinella palmiformis]|uniref:Sulfotransferase domain-containing protein n=1 Tax=Paralvinella palmiformis TaxID=53620 RepID=A0AAD9JSI5_9ANNE|nr:hypothetical protein LSH36_175g04047 [Paralvinella palmiformis]
MTVIRWRYKNIFILLAVVTSAYILVSLKHVIFHEGIMELIFGEDTEGPCNKRVRHLDDNLAKKWPIIGILGPPGSGVVWLRYLIEQLTGIYTGSVDTEYGHLFIAEGQTKKVVAVMAHDISVLPHMKAGIVLYRHMKDTVRSQYAAKHGPGAVLEAPMEAYYAGKEWEMFAMDQGKIWAERYHDYIRYGKPLMIINYDDLSDPDQVKRQLLHISHFVHVPIRQSVLDCLVERISDVDLHPDVKPQALRHGFNPFELLPVSKQQMLLKLENYTEKMVIQTKEGFLPRIHV